MGAEVEEEYLLFSASVSSYNTCNAPSIFRSPKIQNCCGANCMQSAKLERIPTLGVGGLRGSRVGWESSISTLEGGEGTHISEALAKSAGWLGRPRTAEEKRSGPNKRHRRRRGKGRRTHRPMPSQRFSTIAQKHRPKSSVFLH